MSLVSPQKWLFCWSLNRTERRIRTLGPPKRNNAFLRPPPFDCPGIPQLSLPNRGRLLRDRDRRFEAYSAVRGDFRYGAGAFNQRDENVQRPAAEAQRLSVLEQHALSGNQAKRSE